MHTPIGSREGLVVALLSIAASGAVLRCHANSAPTAPPCWATRCNRSECVCTVPLAISGRHATAYHSQSPGPIIYHLLRPRALKRFRRSCARLVWEDPIPGPLFKGFPGISPWSHTADLLKSGRAFYCLALHLGRYYDGSPGLNVLLTLDMSEITTSSGSELCCLCLSSIDASF